MNRDATVHAAHAYDGEPIAPNRIYVAPPDRHLLIERGKMRVTRGPKENRFRPAVDSLFRSAAYAYWRQVIGVILSGALDDGTAGFWTIKQHGGLAVVQNPLDAKVPSMPENALRGVEVDYVATISEMAALLVRSSRVEISDTRKVKGRRRKNGNRNQYRGGRQRVRIGNYEIRETHAPHLSRMSRRFICPQRRQIDAFLLSHRTRLFRRQPSGDRYRIYLRRTLQRDARHRRSVMLLNHLGDYFAEVNQTKLAALYYQKAQEAERRAQFVRQAVLSHEQLSKESLRRQAAD